MDNSFSHSTKNKTEFSGLFNEILERDASIRFTVTGRSMVPFLSGGEVVTIKKVPYQEYRIGDLIFFESDAGSPVLHRVVRRMKKGRGFIFQTRGDGLKSLDTPVQGEKVFGKVCKIERTDGAVTYMESPAQRLLSYLRALFSLSETRFRQAGSAVLKIIRQK